jgi:hypothetical protein
MNVNEMMTNTQLVKTMHEMVSEGMEAYDCLMYAIDEGREYPDALWLVTRALKLDNDAVIELEEMYQYR